MYFYPLYTFRHTQTALQFLKQFKNLLKINRFITTHVAASDVILVAY